MEYVNIMSIPELKPDEQIEMKLYELKIINIESFLFDVNDELIIEFLRENDALNEEGLVKEEYVSLLIHHLRNLDKGEHMHNSETIMSLEAGDYDIRIKPESDEEE